MESIIYSVVVPVYQSSHSVEQLVGRCLPVFEETLKETFEIILVDDGSTSSKTWPTLQQLAQQNDNVRAVRLMRNYGKAAALICGFGVARGQWVVTIDDDLQQCPEDIPLLCEYRQHDVVVARFRKRRHGPLTRLVGAIKGLFDRHVLKLPCRMTPMKLFRSEVTKAMLQTHTAKPFIAALISHVTQDIVTVEVKHTISEHGKSRYNLWKRWKHFSNLLIGNSSALLRLLGAIGTITFAIGFGFAGWIVFKYFSGATPPPGWSSLAVIQLVFGGLIMFGIGVIGDYLIRILDQASGRPTYIVRENTDNNSD